MFYKGTIGIQNVMLCYALDGWVIFVVPTNHLYPLIMFVVDSYVGYDIIFMCVIKYMHVLDTYK